MTELPGLQTNAPFGNLLGACRFCNENREEKLFCGCKSLDKKQRLHFENVGLDVIV